MGRRKSYAYDFLPMLRSYVDGAQTVDFCCPGSLWMQHGMRDICGMVREYISRTAVSFTFDAAGSTWILWRGAGGDLYYGKRGMPRSECVDIREYSGYSRCELSCRDDVITVYFCWNDRAHMARYITSLDRFPHTAIAYEYMLIGQPCGRFREYYIYPGRICQSYGILHPWPEQYVTIRCFGWRLYGLLPCGNIERIPFPQLESE